MFLKSCFPAYDFMISYVPKTNHLLLISDILCVSPLIIYLYVLCLYVLRIYFACIYFCILLCGCTIERYNISHPYVTNLLYNVRTTVNQTPQCGRGLIFFAVNSHDKQYSSVVQLVVQTQLDFKALKRKCEIQPASTP